jgi:hypothetical protein
MANSLDSLSSYYIEDEPIVMEELGRGAYAAVKKVGSKLTQSFIAMDDCACHIIYIA